MMSNLKILATIIIMRVINFLKKALASLASISLLASCTTVGPDYQQPDVKWLQQWQPSVYQQVSSNNDQQTDLQSWWHLFNDPVLNQLVEQAKKNNYSLKIAGLKIFENRALLAIAGSSIYPQLQQIKAGANYNNNKFYNGTATNQSFSATQVNANIGWELDFWGRFQRAIESADAAFFASITNQQDVQVLLSAQVADTYFAYRTTEERITIAHKNADIQKRSFEITTNLFESGQQSELDLQQAKTQYLATLSTIPELELSLSKIRNSLNILLGEAPRELSQLKLASKRYKWPEISPNYFQYIPANILTRRPDVRTAAWLVAAQSAQIGVAEAEYYPAISLFGTIGWSASNLSASSDQLGLSLGPGFSWNFLDYDRIDNNVRLQDARLQQRIEQYQNLVITAAKEVDDAAFSILKLNQQKLLIDQSLIASVRALDIANKRYQEGYADFQRVLDAQRSMFSRSESQLITKGNYISSIVSLYKGMGGGWSEVGIGQLIPAQTKQQMQQRTDWGVLLTAPFYAPEQSPTETINNE